MATKKDSAADTAKDRRAAERRAPPKAAPKETPKAAAKPAIFNSNARAELSPDELRRLISEAAYYRAKKRGFAPGHELEDWIQAEAEVMRRVGARGA
jgi:hypothetical protein